MQDNLKIFVDKTVHKLPFMIAYVLSEPKDNLAPLVH
jgi:hypothetical protein